jgi:hypothetical protein
VRGNLRSEMGKMSIDPGIQFRKKNEFSLSRCKMGQLSSLVRPEAIVSSSEFLIQTVNDKAKLG